MACLILTREEETAERLRSRFPLNRIIVAAIRNESPIRHH
jgi:hypothetical protein